jgi:hypothetical protein
MVGEGIEAVAAGAQVGVVAGRDDCDAISSRSDEVCC